MTHSDHNENTDTGSGAPMRRAGMIRRTRAREPIYIPAPRKTSTLKRIAAALLILVMMGGVAVMGLVFWVFNEYGRDLPDYRQLATYAPPVVTRIHAADGALLTEYATEKRVFVPAPDIPPPLIHAFLSAEDKNFYRHFGVDPFALMRAVLTNVENIRAGRRPVGASTITQQVAKNFLLSNEVSLERKIKEAILAFRMERAFSKDQILALYLNEIYLGRGSYGVAAAALDYFDKSLVDLTLAEAAYLAALPKAPNNYDPVRNRIAAIARRNWVLEEMYENGYISRAGRDAAQAEDLIIRPRSAADGADAPYFTEEVRRELVARYGSDAVYGGGYSVRTTLDSRLQAIATETMTQGLEALDKRQGWRGALGVYDAGKSLTDSGEVLATLNEYAKSAPRGRFPAVVTAINGNRADILLRRPGKGSRDDGSPAAPELLAGQIPFALADWAAPPRRRDGTRPRPIRHINQALQARDIIYVQPPETVPDRLSRYPDARDALTADGIWALGQEPLVQGALVALDPHTGRVLAMHGGYNALTSEFNRATQAKRQPGSAFKPFVYLAALDNGFSPTTRILDAPLVVDQGPGLPKWKPANYSRKFFGPSIMRHGIEQSRNLMTARLAMAVGMSRVQEYARRFGVDEDMPALFAMSLGAGETTLMRLTAAYGMIVNGGQAITPSIIDRVQDRYGKTLYRLDDRPCRKCNLAEPVAKGAIPPDLPDNRDRVTDTASAYQMVTMLEGVVKRGTGRSIGDPGFAVAGKTGTTNENRDAWFIGFTPDLVVGIYVGYDTPRPLGRAESGATAAVPIFSDFIRRAMEGRPAIPFRRPHGVNLFAINADTGRRAQTGDANTIIEAFKPGQRPLTAADSRAVIDVPGAAGGIAADTLPGLY